MIGRRSLPPLVLRTVVTLEQQQLQSFQQLQLQGLYRYVALRHYCTFILLLLW
jgi:hypothetical protein